MKVQKHDTWKTISAAQLRAAFEALGIDLSNALEVNIGNPKDSDDLYVKPKGAGWRLRFTEVVDDPDADTSVIMYRVTYIPVFLTDPCGKCGSPACGGWCDEELP